MKIPVLLRPVALGAHLFGLFCVSVAVALGIWQLGTWEGHREAASAERVERPAAPLVDVMGPDQPFQKDQVARSVTVDGEWLDEYTVYVADRERGDELGYWVLTMFAVEGSESAIPVVRGWTETIEPRPSAPAGPASLAGWLQPPEGKAGMQDEDTSDDVLTQVRMADLVQHVDRDLYGGYLLLDHEVQDVVGAEPATSNGGTESLEAVDLSQVPSVSATTGWKNFLYAIEWWIFAGFALFIWLRWCRDEVIRVRAEETDGVQGGEPGDDQGDEQGEDAHAATEA